MDKDLEDLNFTGIEHIIKCLTRQGDYNLQNNYRVVYIYRTTIRITNLLYISSIDNDELIWRYVPWIMKKDQALAVRVWATDIYIVHSPSS